MIPAAGLALLAIACGAACLETPAATPPADADRSNLLPNAGFEDGIGGWAGVDAELSSASVAHAGGGALSVCMDEALGAGSNFAVEVADDLAPAGGAFSAEAWVRAQMGSSEQSVVLRVWLGDADGAASAAVVASDAWAHVSFDPQVAGEGALRFAVEVTAQFPEECLLLDDVSLVRR